MKTFFSMFVVCIVFAIIAFTTSVWALPINPGFEDNLNGYTTSGNVQVLSNLGPLAPTEGSSFALLSTGPFDVGNDGLPDVSSLLSNTFTLEADASLLTFDYNFITEEFTGASALAYDFFKAYLITPSGDELIAFIDTTDMGFYSIDGGNPVVAPDGSLFLDQTGFVSASLDVSSYAGMDVAINFTVSDEYDGSFDSGVLIDNIGVTTSPVPEPSTILLFSIGLLGLLFVYPKRQRINNG